MDLRPKRIISGGQTGADKGGLVGARVCGITTGGTAPYMYRTEKGTDPELESYGLTQSGLSNYSVRTEQNVRDSDGTVLFGDMASHGSKQTVQLCQKHNKPYTVNPSGIKLRIWCALHKIETLNVAGNRESVRPGIGKIACDTVVEAFKQ